MKKMLFETNLNGHRLEYIHHIYMGMLRHIYDEYVIVVPEEFEEKKKLYEWPEAKHIKFCYITEYLKCNEEGVGLIKQSFYLTRILKKYIKQEKVESVFLISLISYIAALPFYISPNIKVIGILYSIYLYDWNIISWKQRFQNVFKYIIMRMTPCLKTVFILNDENAVSIFNKLYRTHKFQYIIDPYNEIIYNPKSLRKELKISDEDRVYLHFGGLSKRKGTLDILNAIPLLPSEFRKKCIFIFAGKIYNDLRVEFYRILDSLPIDARLFVYDDFCTSEFLADLCVSSDFILAPYYITNCSSGLLAHAAHFGTPIIGPDKGLIGNHIKEYNLGITLFNNTPECLAQKIIEVEPYRIKTEYKEIIKVDNFVDKIFQNF